MQVVRRKRLLRDRSPRLPAVAGADPGPLSSPQRPDSFSRLLEHEAHVRAIAVWDMLGGALAALVGLGALSGNAVARVPLIGLFFMGIGAGLVAAGRSLWRYESAGRHAAVVLNALVLGLLFLGGPGDGSGGLLLLLDAAVIAGSLWALLGEKGSEVFTRRYRELVEQDPRTTPTWWTSALFWIPVAVTLFQVFLAGVTLAKGGHYSRHSW